MDGIDPEVLLEWLQTGIGEERDLQLMALEQLCMLLLMADNIDRCFESCPPRTFIPALCKIFLDETAPDNVLEVTARAITYYLDVSNECTRRITQVEGAVKAICTRLAAAEMSDRASKDLAEQCVKLLERVCQRETMAVYDAGGINAMLALVRLHGSQVHKDTMHSAMSVVTRLCGKMEPTDAELAKCAESLGALLEHDDAKVSESALRCFAALTDRFIRKMMDPAELAFHSNLVEHLLLTLASSNDENSNVSSNFLSIVLSLLSNLCRGSSVVTEKVLSSVNMIKGLSAVLTNKEERVVTDGLRLADLLIVLLCEGRSALPMTTIVSGDIVGSSGSAERVHRQLIDAIRQKDLSSLVDAIETGQVEVNFTDDVGQSLCNWASAFGSLEMVQYLCEKGADVNKGHKSSSLHYAACFGRPDIVKLLLQRGANPDLRDEDGKTALDKARERSDEDHTQVAHILESPTVYMHSKSDDTKTKKEGGVQCKTASVTKAELPNPQLVKKVLHQLLPIFCEIFQKSLNTSVRRTSLSLLRKIVANIGDLRQCEEEEGAKSSNNKAKAERKMSTDVSAGAESLVSVVVSVLDQEDDYEGHEQVLLILQSLLEKDAELWVMELIRLGVFERVEAMAKEPPKGLEQILNEIGGVTKTVVKPAVPIAMEIDVVERAEQMENISIASTITADATPMIHVPTPIVDFGTSSLVLSSQSSQTSTASSSSSASSAILQVVSKLSGGGEKSGSEKKAAQVIKTTLNAGCAYRWKEWRIVRGTSALFIWSDVLLIELPFQSNGWFRYLADNDSHMQFLSGIAAIDQQMTEEAKKKEVTALITRWKAVKGVFDDDSATLPISVLGIPSNSKKVSQKLIVPAWEIYSTRSSEIQIKSTASSTPDGQPNTMTTTIKDDSGGFIFESGGSGNGRRLTVMPEMALPSEFHTGWSAAGVSTRKIKFRMEIQKRKVQELAWKLWNDHLKEAHAKPREALVRLEKAAATIENAVRTVKAMKVGKHKNMKQPRIERVQDLVSAMRVVHESIVDDRRLSTFEFSVSGIVPALYSLLSLIEIHPASYPASIFKETFSSGEALSQLALKMVAVLEASEKFPQYLYDTPGGSSLGLQLLSRRVRTKLEMLRSGSQSADTSKENIDEVLLNKTGKMVKSEPLVSIGQIKQFLLKMVAKQWHDRERKAYTFVRLIEESKRKNTPISFRYTSDFDDQGLIYWLGTNGRTSSEWTNPASINVVKVTCSDNRQPFGKPEDVISRDVNPINCHTSDDKNAHFTIDLGVLIIPSSYTLRHSRGYGRSALRNWLLQGSKDNQVWDVIHGHMDDTNLGEPGSTATWHFSESSEQKQTAYRYIRIAQNGRNSSGQTYYLSVSGFEIYGDVVDVVFDSLGGDEKKEATTSANSSTPTMSAAVTASNIIELLPSLKANNKLKAGLSCETLATMYQRQRTRALRGGIKSSTANELKGALVVRGKDWKWEDQDGGEGNIGHVVSTVDSGWVDVMWENGVHNSYRYGANGHFDIEKAGTKTMTSIGGSTSASSATSTSTMLEAVRTRGRGLISKNSRGGFPPQPHVTTNPIPSLAPTTTVTLSTLASGLGFGLNRHKISTPMTITTHQHHQKMAASTAATPLSRFNSARNAQTTTVGASQTGTSSTTSGGSTSSSAIGKKSMSTTNLVDDRQRSSGPSVASTGQAASAESLQHQTPSLENLLARAMPITFGRIAENQEEHDEETMAVGNEEESDSAASMRSEASEASSQSSIIEEQQKEENDEDQQNTPRDVNSESTPTTPRDEKATNLSVSAPDLAAAKQQGEKNENEGNDEDDEEEKGTAMEEEDDDEEETIDEEEEEEDEDEEIDDKRVEYFDNEDRGLFDKIREAIVGDGTDQNLPQEDEIATSSSSSAQNAGSNAIINSNEIGISGDSGKSSSSTIKKSKKKSLKQKINSYADVIKGLMQTVRMMDPSSAALEMDDMMDDDDYYEYPEEGNEDDPEEELAAHLGIPVESFASMIAQRTPINWKQFSQMVMGSSSSAGGAGSSASTRDRLVARGVVGGGGTGGVSGRGCAHWDEELVIKCNFEALIPAFDPRPGRSNVNQTLEVELPTVVNDTNPTTTLSAGEQQLKLYLRGPNMSGVDNITIEMNNDKASLFRYMQLINNNVNWVTKNDRSRRIWEPTYTLLYCNPTDDVKIEKTKIVGEDETTPSQVNQCLEVIGLLSRIQETLPDASISPNVFISDKLTLKITQVLSDALVVAARALPDWCSRLIYKYPCLFTVETRNMYMQATAFGVSRTVVWLQQRRDSALEKTRGGAQASGVGGGRPHDRYHEYRVGRLRHERVKVTRVEELLLDQAVRLMKFHAERKAVLEIEYTNEEGTGLGPTLEFYALIAAELQRKALAIWVCDDDDSQPKNEERELDLGEGKKPAGYYVRREGGLFPAPLPPHTEEVKRSAEMFRVLGIFLAKVLQDGRLVDLPLSRPFLKLLVHPQVSELADANLRKVLSLDDFEEVNPVKGSFLKELRALAQRKRAIENEPNLDQSAKRRKIGELKLQMKGTTCRVEDLALCFTVNPPSKVFKYEEMELVEGGADIDVTMDNVEQYVEKCEEFYLNTGIAHQMRAFREGFDRVFPLRALRAYSPEEVQRLLSGEQCPEWTRDDILNYTEPKLGYTRESPGFLRFVDVMNGLAPQERKNFLQFATGCSSLPPGGLANLHPRLTIVRKVESGDGSYPSVNTCVHYLKLPEYSSTEILRERLLTAINEKGFHLN